MRDFLGRAFRKFQRDGFLALLQAGGCQLHGRLFPQSTEPGLLAAVLEEVVRRQGAVTIVQIGANTGNTASDPLFPFIKRHFAQPAGGPPHRCRAVLVEPVRHLFEQLRANYADCPGVVCENAAIAATSGTRDFYRLKEGFDPAAHGLPDWVHQLGSLLPEKLPEFTTTTDPERRALVLANVVVEKVPCLSLADLLAKHGIESADLLQIDAEGYDYQILRSLDFHRVTPHFIHYERVHLRRDEPRCRNLLLDHGYRLHDHDADTLATRDPRQGRWSRWRQRAYNAWLGLIIS